MNNIKIYIVSSKLYNKNIDILAYIQKWVKLNKISLCFSGQLIKENVLIIYTQTFNTYIHTFV